MDITKRDENSLILEQNNFWPKSILFLIMMIGIFLIAYFPVTDDIYFFYLGIVFTPLSAMAYVFLPTKLFIMERRSKIAILSHSGILKSRDLNLTYADIDDFIVQKHLLTPNGKKICYKLQLIERNGRISTIFSDKNDKKVTEKHDLIKSYFLAA
ncbi:MAG: hypothetical protein ABI390_03955 [Daejeonella sp.]